jgi:hypothetical protein
VATAPVDISSIPLQQPELVASQLTYTVQPYIQNVMFIFYFCPFFLNNAHSDMINPIISINFTPL